MLVYGDWVEDQVLAPVPHRQYVFTLPRILRPHFKYRPFLGELCRRTGQLLTECFRAVAPDGRPAFILFVQTFGTLVTFQPHIHALVADGVFQPNGVFRVLPPIPTDVLEEGLREKVFALLKREGCIDDQLIDRMRAWHHTGFSTHNGVRLRARDADGRRQLARYMIRPPFALEKMTYVETSATVIYRAKMHATLKRNFQVLPGAKWLQLLLQHIPDKNEHTVRYYGAYSSRYRAKHPTPNACDKPAHQITEPDTDLRRSARAAWAKLIYRVYEVDPLTCPKCDHEMRVIALIHDPSVVQRILEHLGLWDPEPVARDPPQGADPAAAPHWPAKAQLPLEYVPVPDIA